MIGKIISHYKILEKIGSGGMGIVYKAEDLDLKRIVALKFLPSELTRSEETRKRFIHEAQSASALDHPNICTIYEISKTDDDIIFISMGYYEGETLKDKIESGILDTNQAIGFAYQIANGLRAAHEKGLVHRDIKPANIFITENGVAKILDFGLAKSAEYTQLTKEGSTVGTVAYMSPEQTRGDTVDKRSDIWSLGVILYEMLIGEQPFKGDYEQAVIYSILNEDPAPITSKVDLPPELAPIIAKALAKDQDKRYQTVEDLLSDLEKFTSPEYKSLAFGRSKISKIFYRRMQYVAAGILVLLVVSLLYLKYPFDSDAGQIESLAVLPFENLTGNDELEYFVAGMHSSLIGDIGKISALRVISKTTSNRYKNVQKSIPEIASELDVDALIEASVLSLGDSVHLQIKLVDAFPREQQLLVQDYHEEKKQILNLYSKVAKEISSKINVILTPQEEEMLAETDPVNPEAYKAYLLGMYHLNQLTPESKDKGMQYLHEAVRIDPGEAFAYAGLALGYIEIGHSPLASEDVHSKAKAAALQAIKLDPNMAEAHAALGEIYLYYDWNFDLAEQYIRKALELNPNLALTHYHYSWMLYLFGNMEQAIVEHKLAQKYDPLNPLNTAWLGALYCYDGQYKEAVKTANESFELYKDYPVGYYVLGVAYLGMGKTDEAIAAHKKLADRYPLWSWPLCLTYTKTGQIDKAEQLLIRMEKTKVTPWTAYARTVMYSGMGKLDKAIEWLNYEPHHAFTAWASVIPEFENLRQDPRFDTFLKRLNLPE